MIAPDSRGAPAHVVRGWSRGALLALVLVLVGCAPPASGPVATPVTVVVAAARTGSPTPSWNDVLERQFSADVAAGGSWTFIAVDGRPATRPPLALVAVGDNDLVRGASVAALRTEAQRRLTGLRADDPEVDVLAAVDLAARSVADRPGPRTVIVLDSLLQTTGSLRFADDTAALLSAEPGAVADQLATRGALPDLTGVAVVLAGAGDTVAPQDPLPPPARAALIALWTEVLERAGAAVTVEQAPLPGGPPVGAVPPVTPVPVAAPEPVEGSPVALPDSAVGFLPDQAVFRDPQQAAAVLRPFAERLLDGGVTAVLTGTTSSAGTPDGRLALSRDRAAAVAGLLRAGGAPEGSVRVRGVGADFAGFVPDRDPAGNLDPVLAARNRQVLIELRR